MLVFLIASLIAGLSFAITGVWIGLGLWAVALWYGVGCWAGFLLAMLALLIPRRGLSPPPARRGRITQH